MLRVGTFVRAWQQTMARVHSSRKISPVPDCDQQGGFCHSQPGRRNLLLILCEPALGPEISHGEGNALRAWKTSKVFWKGPASSRATRHLHSKLALAAEVC